MIDQMREALEGRAATEGAFLSSSSLTKKSVPMMTSLRIQPQKTMKMMNE